MQVEPRDLVDGALELSVVGSFSKIGFETRRRLYGWTEPRDDALAGKTALITGPTSGLGRATTDALGALGARLVLVGRDPDRLETVRAEVAARHGDDRVATAVADMSSLASVAAAVETIASTEHRLDVLVDNAGAIHDHREETEDGLEATFATMVVGPFRLIAGLLPLLRSTGGARVIAVTSGGQYAQRLDLDDLGYRRDEYNGTKAYARAKRAQVALVREWARRLGQPAIADLTVNAMHPGWADTPGLEASLPTFARVMGPVLRTPAAGIDTLVWLASSEAAGEHTGELFLDRRPRPFDRAPVTRLSAQQRRRLWELIVDAARIDDPLPEHRPHSQS